MRRREGHFKGAGGAKIYFQQWLPDQQPRAMLLVAHGAAEHGGRYVGFARHFVQRGYGVATLDHVGHGHSEGTPGYVRDFADYVDTLDAYTRLVRSDYPALPFFLLGHSMGGLISCCYLLQNQDAFAGCILSGPAIKTELEPGFLQVPDQLFKFRACCINNKY